MTPPTPDELLWWMRDDVEKEEQFPSIVLLGADDEIVVSPCAEVGTVLTLTLLTGMIAVGEVPHPDWVAVVADTFAYQGEEYRTMMDLESMFAAGDPAVTESLHGMCMAPDGPMYAVSQNYYRAADGTVTWFEPKQVDLDVVHGGIVTAMRRLLEGP